MEDLTGKQLGPYQIRSPLGEGGMAAVYKAYQPSMDRYVALKVLPRHFASDREFVERFSQEARVIANLQHPHILPVHDFGESDGYTYLAMRFIDGGTLADWLKGNGPLSLEKIRNIVTQVGGALDYAHAQGVIHRDIKPGNILVDRWDNCLLTDFGLAKMVESSSHLTQTGGILGTPAYMSPEQGLGQKIDGRSDIYSLGVVLYQMAIGRLPYQAETPMAVVIKHIHDPLPPPSQYNPDVPEAVELVILKALAKTPEDRFRSAGDMVKALQSATEKPTVARAKAPVPPEVIEEETAVSDETAVPERTTVAPPPLPPKPEIKPTIVVESDPNLPPAPVTPERKQKRPFFKRPLFYIGLAVIAVIILGIVILGGGDGDDEDNPFADINSLDDLDATVNTAYANDDIELVLFALNRAIEIEPDQADLYCELGYALNDVEDYEAAANAFADCLDLAQEQGSPDLESEAFGQMTMTEVNQAMEEIDDPATALEIIDEATQNAAAPPWLICERAEYNLDYDSDRAVSDFEVCRQEMGDDDYWRNRSEAMIGMIYGYDSMASEDYYSAIDQFSVWADLERENPWPHCAIGDAHISMQEFSQALEQYTICLEKALGQDDTDAEHEARGGQFYTEARLALFEGDLNRALENYNQSIEWSPDKPHVFCERGVIHHEMGALDEARSDYEVCRDMYQDEPDGRAWAEDLLQSLDNVDQ